MTIFWCGAEDIDFDEPERQEISTSTSEYDTLFSRGALYMSNSRNIKLVIKFTETPITDYLWIGFIYKDPYCWYSDRTLLSLGLYNTSTQISLRFGPNSANEAKLQLFIGATAVAITQTDVLDVDCKIDVEIINYNSEYEGTIKIYIDAVEVISYTGILGTVTETGLAYLTFNAVGSNMSFYVSQIIIADEDTRLLSVKTLAPNAAGDTNQWSGAYTDIDEVDHTITDALRTQEADKLFTTNLTGLPTGKWAVRAVKVVAASSPAKEGLGLQIGIKTNSELYLGDSIIPKFEGGNPIAKMFQVNPATLENFTMAEIEALQIAIKSVTV